MSLAERRIELTPPRRPVTEHPQLARIEAALTRIEKLLDEFCDVFLNARFQEPAPIDGRGGGEVRSRSRRPLPRDVH
jgi:hypothetical protein